MGLWEAVEASTCYSRTGNHKNSSKKPEITIGLFATIFCYSLFSLQEIYNCAYNKVASFFLPSAETILFFPKTAKTFYENRPFLYLKSVPIPHQKDTYMYS
jgi:hypothetical protein